MKSKETFLSSQTDSSMKQITELRKILTEKDTRLSTCTETNRIAMLKLKQEEAGMHVLYSYCACEYVHVYVYCLYYKRIA